MKFRAKPLEIEASNFDGTAESMKAVCLVLGIEYAQLKSGVMKLDSIDGVVEAKAGDWVIKLSEGDFAACAPDEFVTLYEPLP